MDILNIDEFRVLKVESNEFDYLITADMFRIVKKYSVGN